MGNIDGLPGPTDAWLTLGALARETERIRLGTLLTAGTFRLPGHLAIMVAQVDEMSGGRVELGLGAGWYEDEHAAYGIPFPSLKERFDRLEEQLSVITGLWATPAGERFSFHGKYYQLSSCPALPHPLQRPKPPMILGGLGADVRRRWQLDMPMSSMFRFLLWRYSLPSTEPWIVLVSRSGAIQPAS
ncbi:luciferase family protein, partial [mine drainage metagenome]